MKKSLLLLTFLLSSVLSFSQAMSSPGQSTQEVDYSNFYVAYKTQSWILQGVASNDYYTAVFIRININSNAEGWFSLPESITLSGNFGSYNPVGLQVASKDHKLGSPWRYTKGNKGKGADIAVLFPRIPYGVESVDYREPGFINWANIPVKDNQNPCEQTNWTEGRLREYWASNKARYIEGIYYFTSASDKDWWGPIKHTFGVIKDGYEYKLIYLRGSNANIWKEGEVKATFVSTATKGLYKATKWYMENKVVNEDFYLKFDDGSMSIYENTSNVTAEFLKLYPSVDENDEGYPSGYAGSQPQVQNTSSVQASGSGIFISDKVIATNHHVVESANKIEVVVKNGKEVNSYEAEILSLDKVNDLALLVIKDGRFNGIGELPFAISSRTKDVGTSVFTMGYPLAQYMGEEVKITDGIINSKTGYNGDIVTYQISAPIQPGSSGGPLFDKQGNLIGITNAGITQAQNVGYAIKGSYLCNLVDSAPISISLPEKSKLANMELPEQIKVLSKYIVYIKIY